MPIKLTVERQTLNFDVDAIGIGRDPENQVALPNDSRLAPMHAILRNVNGRWIIESHEGGPIRIGNGRPSRFAWLNPGDVIHLTETGPELIFESQDGGVSVVNPQTLPVKLSPGSPVAASAPATAPYIPFIPDVASHSAPGKAQQEKDLGTAAAGVHATQRDAVPKMFNLWKTGRTIWSNEFGK